MVSRILLVDDEENILRGYQRVLRSSFEVDLALGGAAALDCMGTKGPYAVIVADMRMPGMSGLDLLAETRARFPKTIRIMLTGDPDQRTAQDAVNHGRVFRFLAKPCPPEELELAIRAGLRQYELIIAEKELLESTLTGTISVLSELLAGVDPVMFSRSQVVREQSAQLARKLGCDDVWAIEIAALLAPIGRITLPKQPAKGHRDSVAIEALISAVPEMGARLLEPIPRLEGVAKIIRYQAKGYDGSGSPFDSIQGESIPMGSRILKVLWDYHELAHSRKSLAVALEEMQLRSKIYDPNVLQTFSEMLHTNKGTASTRAIKIKDLRPGMVLASDLHTEEGTLVLPTGLRLGAGHIEILSGLIVLVALQESASIQLPKGEGHEA